MTDTEIAIINDIRPTDIRDNAHRIYAFMAEHRLDTDSVIREELFDRAATALGIDYDVLYYAWLRETPVIS